MAATVRSPTCGKTAQVWLLPLKKKSTPQHLQVRALWGGCLRKAWRPVPRSFSSAQALEGDGALAWVDLLEKLHGPWFGPGHGLRRAVVSMAGGLAMVGA